MLTNINYLNSVLGLNMPPSSLQVPCTRDLCVKLPVSTSTSFLFPSGSFDTRMETSLVAQGMRAYQEDPLPPHTII
jgi:hypothetical protein